MEIIKTEEQLIAAAARNGVTLNETEAATLLYIFEDDEEKIAVDERYAFFMAGIGYERSTNLNEIVELAKEINSEKLMDELPYGAQICNLRLIEHLLDSLADKVETVVKPVVRTYNVLVVANYAKTIQVEAVSWAEATDKANAMINAGEVTFGEEDFVFLSVVNAVPVEGSEKDGP